MDADLSIKYCGLELKHPFMPGASPMVDSLDTVRQLEDAGASAIVMHSLFEEQIVGEELGMTRAREFGANSPEAAGSYLPDPEGYKLGPDEYLRQIEQIKKAVAVPVIASLNGNHREAWVRYAQLIEAAGADALELNTYEMTFQLNQTTDAIEKQTVDLVAAVRAATAIPLTVKLLPFFAGLPSLAQRLSKAGASGLVLFNRTYQPVIDLEELEMSHAYPLSSHDELPLRLRWLGMISPSVDMSLAASGGVYTVDDALRAVMCGAHAVQMVSALLRYGPNHLTTIIDGVREWMTEHEYESVNQMRGSMNVKNCPDPRIYTRWGYIKTLMSWA